MASPAACYDVRDARFVVHPLMLGDDRADDADVIAWGRSFRDGLGDHTTGVTYINFTGDEGARPRAHGVWARGPTSA